MPVIMDSPRPTNHSAMEFTMFPVHSTMASQLSWTTIAIVAIAATIPAITPATNAGAPRITAPTAAIANPITIKASFSQLKPSSHIEKKFTTATPTPARILAIPVNVTIIGFMNVRADDAALLPSRALKPATKVVATLPPAANNAEPIPAFVASSRPSFDAITAASFLEMVSPIVVKTVSEIFNAAIFLSVSVPIIIATVPMSRFSRNSVIPLYTSIHLTFVIAVDTTSNSPCAHVFSVSAAAAKSNVEKKLLIPSAILYPNCLKSNSCPNASAA